MGAQPPAAGQFFGKKMAILMRFGSHFACFQSHILKEQNFLMFESQLKKSLPLLQDKSKTCFKSCIFGVKFCDLTRVWEIKVHRFLQHF